jgi:L-rhamnose mutarotase
MHLIGRSEFLMQRHCLTLDLRPDPELIVEYINLHRIGRPEIHQSIRESGVQAMEIYYLDGRLFMIMDTSDDFTFERKAALDLANPAVQEWEKLMSRFQDVNSGSNPTKRWMLMENIFNLL